MSQLEFVSLDSLLPSTHSYRRFQAYVPDATDILADVVHINGADAAFIKNSPFKQKRIVRKERIDIMQNFAHPIPCRLIPFPPTQEEGQGALPIHQA
jgi:hypothetical protein